MSPEIEDIKRVLTICFRDGASQTADDLERILSFDMGWMDTETAHDAIKALTFAGWIIDDDGSLSPNCDIRGIKAPLGWQPRPSRLTDPVVNEITTQEKSVEPIAKPPVIQHRQEGEVTDPRAKMQKRLVKYISKQSGIDVNEIERRAERKMMALRYCTMWLALCLISREQDLEMNSIIDSFSAR
tara:strand:- start:17 stop:571 length:555 start_codon:yes stop_codon:yes gene_type:complete